MFIFDRCIVGTRDVIVLVVDVSEEGGCEFDVGLDEFSGEREFFVFDDGLREADDVFDLASVDVVGGEVVDVETACVELRVREQVGPDLLAAGGVERLVGERDGDARVEGLVEAAHAVGGEEHDAVVLLEQPQEDADHGVAVDVVVRALLQEDVGLVQQDHCVPLARDFEDVAQFVLEFVDGRAQFADRDRVERLAQQL